MGKFVYLFAVVGLSLSLLVSYQVNEKFRQRAYDDLHDIAVSAVNSIKADIQYAQTVLISLNALYQSSSAVTPAELGVYMGHFRTEDLTDIYEKNIRAFGYFELIPGKGMYFDQSGVFKDDMEIDSGIAARPPGHEITVSYVEDSGFSIPGIGDIAGGDLLVSKYASKPEGDYYTFVIVNLTPELEARRQSLVQYGLTLNLSLKAPEEGLMLVDHKTAMVGKTPVYIYSAVSDPGLTLPFVGMDAFYTFIAGISLTAVILSLLVYAQRKRDEAEQANRLKSEFLATMSHEIRSPMSGVLGMAELLLDSPLNTEQKALAKTIINSGEVLLHIIEDILDFSKIEADRVELEEQPVNLLDIIDDTCLLYAAQAREKAIEIVVNYKPGSEQFFYADPVRIRQILSNLLNNAIKFTASGYIIVSVRQDTSAPASDGHVTMHFMIRDTGIGIAAADQKKIFDKFTQANAATTRKFGGTGLGLSICQRLVRMMGGDITVESAPGQGATFSFYLPLKRNTEEFITAVQPAGIAGRRILIVDDLPATRDALAAQLTSAGVVCHLAGNGAEALEILEEGVRNGVHYDAIMIDYLMPIMNGDELAAVIGADRRFDKTCLILLSGAGNIVGGRTAIGKYFSAHIAKPVLLRSLLPRIAAILQVFEKEGRNAWAKTDALSLPAEGVDSYALRGISILLVEDSRLNQAFGEEVLRQTGAAVTLAANGLEAIEAVRRERFDIIFMDCLMPVMDGFTATAEIRKLEEAGEIVAGTPIVALTANAMKGDREACLRAGMTDHLSKPVRKRDLIEKVLMTVVRRHPAATVTVMQDIQLSVIPPVLCEKTFAEAADLFAEKFPYILECYLEDTATHLKEIEGGIRSANADDILRAVHSIKSSSRRIGAIALSQIAGTAEADMRKIASEDLQSLAVSDEMAALLARLSAAFADFRAEVDSRRSRLKRAV